MYLNGNKVFSSGTLVLLAGESGAIDFPVGAMNLSFLNQPNSAPYVRQNGWTVEFVNFDVGGEMVGSFNFQGADGSAFAGREIYFAYAIHGVGTSAGMNWVIHFTVTIV